ARVGRERRQRNPRAGGRGLRVTVGQHVVCVRGRQRQRPAGRDGGALLLPPGRVEIGRERRIGIVDESGVVLAVEGGGVTFLVRLTHLPGPRSPLGRVQVGGEGIVGKVDLRRVRLAVERDLVTLGVEVEALPPVRLLRGQVVVGEVRGCVAGDERERHGR